MGFLLNKFGIKQSLQYFKQIDEQIKNIDKANQEYQNNMNIEDDSIQEEDMSQEQELNSQKDQLEDEESIENNKQENNELQSQNSDDEYNENFDQFEDYMEQIDEQGMKAFENEADDYNEMAMMEEEDDEDNQNDMDDQEDEDEESQNQQDDELNEDEESQNQQDDQSNEDEEEQDPDENMEEIFQQIEQGTNNQNMDKLEQNLISKKPWQQRGEIRAIDRDVNGLVEEELEFDRGLRMEKQIDENKNKSFEDVIRQRILDQTFDDRSHLEYKKKQQQQNNKQVKEFPELNFEKDQRGLVGLYEDEYKEKVMGINDKKSKEDQAQLKIKELYRAICFSIDQMSRLHFIPGDNKVLKDHKADDQFVIEEKVPLVVKVQKQQTYSEMNNPLKKDLQTKEEMTQHDKKKLRRKIKKYKKIKKIQNEEKELLKTGLSKNEKKLLDKNQSKIQKKIKDSKIQSEDLQKSSQIFKNLTKYQQKSNQIQIVNH